MFINLLENPELIRGAARMVAEEDGIHLFRMTDELQDFYSYSDVAELRASCTSGIRIVFETDSPLLTMGVRFGRCAREYFYVDIMIDNMECLRFGPDDNQDEYIFSTELPEGDKRIEIYLSHCSETIVTGLEVAEDANVSPCEEYDHKIMFIGDSITQGMTAFSGSRTYASLLAAAFEVEFHNIAVGGAVMRGKVGELALALDWDDAVVAFGVNDCNGCLKLEDVAAETTLMLENLSKRKGAKIYLLTPISTARESDINSDGISLQQYRDAIAEAAAPFDNVTVIDGASLVPGKVDLFFDGLHPNEAGMAVYAENLYPQILSE